MPRYNPAPGWPAAPQGWLPPRGWRPEPGWAPAPDGWQLVVPSDGDLVVVVVVDVAAGRQREREQRAWTATAAAQYEVVSRRRSRPQSAAHHPSPYWSVVPRRSLTTRPPRYDDTPRMAVSEAMPKPLVGLTPRCCVFGTVVGNVEVDSGSSFATGFNDVSDLAVR